MSPETQNLCACSVWGDRTRIGLGAETADLLHDRFVEVRERNPWLSAVRCRGCAQPWYVAVDTVDDDYYFRRLTADELTAALERDEWPSDYDGFVNVWHMAADQGFEARLRWPWKGEQFDVR